MTHPTWTLALLACLALSCAHTAVGPDSEKEDAMPAPTHVHHDIDYIELTVHDMAAAQAFYAAAFGWTFNDYGPEYAGVRRGEGEMAGLRLETGATPADGRTGLGVPLVVLYSADLDATLASVRAAGGTLVVEPFAFPGGRRFHFQDPSGNELAVYAID